MSVNVLSFLGHNPPEFKFMDIIPQSLSSCNRSMARSSWASAFQLCLLCRLHGNCTQLHSVTEQAQPSRGFISPLDLRNLLTSLHTPSERSPASPRSASVSDATQPVRPPPKCGTAHRAVQGLPGSESSGELGTVIVFRVKHQNQNYSSEFQKYDLFLQLY